MYEIISFIVSVFLIVQFFVDLTALGIINSFYRKYKTITALRERFVVASALTLSSLLLAFLGFNRVFDWHWSSLFVLVVLSLALLIQWHPKPLLAIPV